MAPGSGRAGGFSSFRCAADAGHGAFDLPGMPDPEQCICVLAHHTPGCGPAGYIKANIILQLRRKKPQHEPDCCLTKRKTIAALVSRICQNDHWPLPDTFLVQSFSAVLPHQLPEVTKVQRGRLNPNHGNICSSAMPKRLLEWS